VTTRWIIAAVHLIALGIGLGAVVVRGAAFRGALDHAGVQRVLRADSFWGLAALLWISTGVARAFFGLEKGTEYYLGSAAFLHKMAAFILVLLLEIAPMVGLVGWRMRLRKGEAPDTSRARTYSTISYIQAVLVIFMVLAATAMARGLFH
jgi:putative membrane protein